MAKFQQCTQYMHSSTSTSKRQAPCLLQVRGRHSKRRFATIRALHGMCDWISP